MWPRFKVQKFSTRLMLITLASGLIPIIIFAVLAQFCGTRFHREMNGTLARLNTEEWVRTEKVLRAMAEDPIRERTAHAVLLKISHASQDPSSADPQRP